MNDIVIRRKHGKTIAAARASAEHMANKLKEKFDLACAWDGDTLRFKRPGVAGELAVDSEEVGLRIQLGFLLSALQPAIEREVHKFFDANFAV